MPLGLIRSYYERHRGNPHIFPFAAQLYYIGYHWFTINHTESDFVDECFRVAGRDVQANPTYNQHSAGFICRSMFSLAGLGGRHMREHIRPTFEDHLNNGILKKMSLGATVEEAYRLNASALRSEHQSLLEHSIPYGINRLFEEEVITGCEFNLTLAPPAPLMRFNEGRLQLINIPVTPIPRSRVIQSIQSTAISVRFYGAVDVLEQFAEKGLISNSDIYSWAHLIE